MTLRAISDDITNLCEKYQKISVVLKKKEEEEETTKKEQICLPFPHSISHKLLSAWA